jgi:hypothetical protein
MQIDNFLQAESIFTTDFYFKLLQNDVFTWSFV